MRVQGSTITPENSYDLEMEYTDMNDSAVLVSPHTSTPPSTIDLTQDENEMGFTRNIDQMEVDSTDNDSNDDDSNDEVSNDEVSSNDEDSNDEDFNDEASSNELECRDEASFNDSQDRDEASSNESECREPYKYGKDLAEYVPGLYRLLDLCKDDGTNGFVDKITISRDYLEKLCNNYVQSSFKSISEIDFVKLNAISIHLIGCYGNHALIAGLLKKKEIIDQQIYEALVASNSSSDNTNKSTLRPGIYLLVVSHELGLVIHWPEVGCYEENASSQCKKNMTNLHRYLTKLTDHQLCLMDSKDLESFDWNLDCSDNSERDSDDENGSHYKFEVKLIQEEQEDFKLQPGFKVDLPDKVKTEINNLAYDDISLHPIVVESSSGRSFATRQLAFRLCTSTPTIPQNEFAREIQKKLRNRMLLFDREKMNMKSLEIFIKHGLSMEDELLSNLRNAIAVAKLRFEKKKDQERNAIKKDSELISNMAWEKLRASYSQFEQMLESPSQENINDYDLERIRSNYLKIDEQIDGKIGINSKAWIRLKRRYYLNMIIIVEVLTMIKNNGNSNEILTESAIDLYYTIFMDDENDAHKLISKYGERLSSLANNLPTFFANISFTPENIIRIVADSIKRANETSDINFIQEFMNLSFFDGFNGIKNKVVGAFFEEYQKWRKSVFPSNIKDILPKSSINKQVLEKLNYEFEKEVLEIQAREFQRICDLLEEKYKNGSMRLKIINITESENGFRFHHEIEEILTEQLHITIYETTLEHSDTLRLQEDEFYVPNIALKRGEVASFHLDPRVYDIRKISQFENRKFLLVLYNKKSQKIEIFLDTAERLAQNFKSTHSFKPIKTLSVDDKFLIAINDSKKLIAIYHIKKAELDVFNFIEGQALYPRNPKIQLKHWYNNDAPTIQHFLFINSTEELCFVEKSGRTRIFNLINQQFRPTTCDLPSDATKVLSSPDGSCIVAFVREKSGPKTANVDDHTENEYTDSEDDGTDVFTNKTKEICRAYVYFCTTFGYSNFKVINLPPTIQSLEFLQFSCINRLQTHLMSLDLKNGRFGSSIVKITLEKTQYRFQKQKQTLGSARLIDSNHKYAHIEGKNTHFQSDQNVQRGEYIVLMGERFKVIDVISDTKLRVTGNFKPTSKFNSWTEFRIEPKTKLNGLIDAYRLMFEKYPVESYVDPDQNRSLNLQIVLDIEDEDVDKYCEKFEDYINETFEGLKRSTKKPTSILKKFSTSVITFQELHIEHLKRYSNYKLGEWIIQLCCLIPIQIAIARNNLFQPLRDGLSSNDIVHDDGSSHHVDSIAKNISFGWYEGIFKYFGDKKVKVVSSMGEQSCGKSFMLNHLVGTTFDGSAMRCVDGVWMSLVNTKEYIYVTLNFEGLNFLEKSSQEDMFLTLFNTVISNIILFKNQFAVNKDMSSMFQRFQDGAMLFDPDPKVFQARLCIIIKDVPKADKEDIVREFQSKISQLVSEGGKDNFISRMYKGGLDIIPWPMFNDAGWFKTLSNVNKDLEKQKAKYDNARTFLQNTKLIMAKLKICDWGSLDESLIQIRVATLKGLLSISVSYGLEQKSPDVEPLKNHDTGEPIEDPMHKLSKILYDFEGSDDDILPDTDIQLYEDSSSFVELSEDLRDYFESNVQSRQDSSDDTKWFYNLSRFFRYIVDRRVARVTDWYRQNTTNFPQDNSDIVNGRFAMKHELDNLERFWTLCGLTCYQCGLKCVKNREHEDEHDCLTDHKCHLYCHFSDQHNVKLIPSCNYKAGHEGIHICNKLKVHQLCGQKCSLHNKRNCLKVCAKKKGHHDEHLCQSTRHFCEESCSLSTKSHKGEAYKCPNKCVIPCEDQHEIHRCEDETCPIQDEHQCRELCEESGICKVVIAKQGVNKESEKELLTKYVQSSERLKCIKKIPQNEFKHPGKHSHEEDGFHFCDAKCQFCECFCTLPYGHTQLHDTKHGNMIQIDFNEDDEYAGYKSIGNQGNFYCKDLGRHRHIDYCQNEKACKSGKSGQDIQHITNDKPNHDKPLDFISHRLFWERTGFKDPYSVQEQQEFAKCDHECSDEKHSQGSTSTPIKSFCELPLFHAPFDPSSNPPNNYGHISSDGHYYNCENPDTREAAAFHIVFVLDRSESMSYNDIKPSHWSSIFKEMKANHNNRLGAAYNAVYQFMETRLTSTQDNQNQSSPVLRDSVSLILFDHNVIVPFENRNLTESGALLTTMLQYKTGGGKNFDLAIRKAGDLIYSYFDPTKTNVIILLSDGECGIPTNQLKISINNDSQSQSLEEMARIAQSYHPPNTSSDALRCQFVRTTNEPNLVNHFTSVAESLKKHT
ncbi:15834_t:CDS:10 [Funneliformis geosporum]|uniref:13693_t:CDS:1 n=1 Tax=Funneliformis geosporum TaxID=1117311 RepID=A0A9W4WH67_9GLOM|nr:13693_t:CDS:10 [Funneliformis geosporum]CAI2161942.1 15834_t:CDS:10 [Funneliformis geosporum]